MSIQKEIQQIVIKYLEDGKERSVDEIKFQLHKNGMLEEQIDKSFRMALHTLKKENSNIKNPRRGIYYMETSHSEEKKVSKYDFDGYKTITESTRKEPELYASITEDGDFRLNEKLCALFPQQKARVIMKPDGSQLVLLFPEDKKETICFGENGSTKNYHIVKELSDLGKAFPVYYVGDWDEEENIWIGIFTNENPIE